MRATIKRRKVTPPQYAAECGIDPAKVVGWIKSGELKAINVATRRGGRPRYLIDLDDIAAFEAARSVTPPEHTPPQRRRSAPIPRTYY